MNSRVLWSRILKVVGVIAIKSERDMRYKSIKWGFIGLILLAMVSVLAGCVCPKQDDDWQERPYNPQIREPSGWGTDSVPALGGKH